eukprot:TRINITY_DN3195_c0_g1_i7.p3 TRINITY_DN3195_c0_g1~~TRINITY_DN3195_c0_g1_i7.p3  ORF type:complete len:174 (+),score=41.72 TRINITY_DN3195_c0_g1_i7:25-522(+)
MIRRPPRSTPLYSSAASDVYKRQVISQERDGQKTTTKNFITRRTNSYNLYTLDIEGAQPKSLASRFYNKPDRQNYNGDIEGSMPMESFGQICNDRIELNKPNNNLRTEDIEGSSPNAFKGCIHTKRSTNPISPKYKLPSVEMRLPTPPKFIRDTLRTDVLCSEGM